MSSIYLVLQKKKGATITPCTHCFSFSFEKLFIISFTYCDCLSLSSCITFLFFSRSSISQSSFFCCISHSFFSLFKSKHSCRINSKLSFRLITEYSSSFFSCKQTNDINAISKPGLLLPLRALNDTSRVTVLMMQSLPPRGGSTGLRRPGTPHSQLNFC